MNITTKLTAITCLLFLFASCTSDDNKTEEPKGKKHYLLTTVNYTTYKVDPMQAGDFTLNYTPEYRAPEVTASFTLTYGTDNQLSELLLTKKQYENESVVDHHIYRYKPEYNASQQIKTLTISSQDNNSQYSFSYENEQLKALQARDNAGISYDQQFIYNNLKQFTQATVQMIENEPQTIELAYTYNAANQLVRMTNGNDAIDFSYATGKNPFDALPFDLTTLMLDNIYFVPLTYKFTNTLASYALSTEEQPYLLEHVYNEDNYIIQTKIYRGTIVNEKHYMLIVYKYEVTDLE